MAEIPDRIKKIIIRFINELADNDIKVEQAILFGSYAQGTFDDWSDIDLAIVSKAFTGERFSDRNKIRRIKLGISCDLEPMPYNPVDFNTDDPFVKRILKTGISIEGVQ